MAMVDVQTLPTINLGPRETGKAINIAFFFAFSRLAIDVDGIKVTAECRWASERHQMDRGHARNRLEGGLGLVRSVSEDASERDKKADPDPAPSLTILNTRAANQRNSHHQLFMSQSSASSTNEPPLGWSSERENVSTIRRISPPGTVAHPKKESKQVNGCGWLCVREGFGRTLRNAGVRLFSDDSYKKKNEMEVFLLNDSRASINVTVTIAG